MEKLKNCPFCNADDVSIHLIYTLWHESQIIDKDEEPSEVAISCGDCGIDMKRETRKEVIKDWNTRAK